MNDVGFNPQKVNAATSSVLNAYKQLGELLSVGVQTRFVNSMATIWGSPIAQEFFMNSFKPAVDSLTNDVTVCFQSVISAMNAAAIDWEQTTGLAAIPVAFEPVVSRIDVSCILPSLNGDAKIKRNADAEIAALRGIGTECDTALMNARSAVTDSGFLGGNQAENLIGALDIVKNKISNAINTLVTDTQAAIAKSEQAYATQAGVNSSNLTAQ